MEEARDPLTGLATRELAQSTIAEWQAEASSADETASIHALTLGLRRFDTVNLAYGESAGDAALVELAARLIRFAEFELDGDWVAARLSGGTFFLASNRPCSRERWQWLAEALTDAISRPIGNVAKSGPVRLWPRIAMMRVLPADQPHGVFDRLAVALNTALQPHGKRVLWVDGERNVAGRSAAQLEADLMEALHGEQIEILFQPQYSAADNSLVGAEALARWHHPELGQIGAEALFAIAERADHVAQLSRHIAKKSLKHATRWPDHLRLSLNITPTEMASHQFSEEFLKAVEETEFDAARLTLEIVEQALLTDLEQTEADLDELVNRGMRIALDDFGAGFCNFRYLKFLPLHYLKLDRLMLEDVARDKRDLAIFRGIVAMAKALDLQVIAEGVEGEDQRSVIVDEGADFYQGFLMAAPMSADEFLALAKI